jgi:hypothetical protein
MRNMGMLIPIAFIVIISRVVSAETWKAYTVLDEEKSKSWRELEGATFGQRGLCTKVPIRYTLELADNTFTATSSFGKMFSIPVPADGVIKKSYKRAGLTKPLEMTGNVKSRELEIFEPDMGCYFKLTPESSPPPPLPWSRPAGMSEADYCRALTQTYETYVTGSTSVSSTHIPNTVDGNVAVLQCEAGNTAAGIPVLERKLRDAKVDMSTLPRPPSQRPPAQMTDADYCRALTQKYEAYVSGSTSVSGAHILNTVDGNVAVLQCETGNTASGIPVLERKLRDAKIDLPARG